MSVCPYHGVTQPCSYIGCPSGTYSPSAPLQQRGEAFIDPLVERGEALLETARTPEEDDELRSIQAIILARQKHTTQFPLANTSQEESAQDLADEEARSAKELEEDLHKAWQIAKPVLWEAFKLGMAAAGAKR